MEAKDVFSLGLGLKEPWKLGGQRLDVEKRPHELHLEVVADRGALFPCPECQRACKAHDFESFTWQHLNFFQHHCFITARVPRVDCPDHGVKRAAVPWARPGSKFTLLFEQAALILVREMPVLAAARFMGITDKRLWRLVAHYVRRAVGELDLSAVRAVGLDETAAKRGHNYVTVFIDMDRADKPVIYVTERCVFTLTPEGLELMFATNYLGHFALTGLLLPAMISTPGSRVVAITSLARHVGRIDFSDLHGRARYGRWTAYGQSKLADLIFAIELDRRLRRAKADTIAVAAHPGYAATNLQTGSNWIRNTYYAIGNTLFAQSAYAGAWPQLYAATAEGVHGGELYGPGQPGGTRGHPKRDRIEARALDPATGRRLWEVSVEATGVEYGILATGGSA